MGIQLVNIMHNIMLPNYSISDHEMWYIGERHSESNMVEPRKFGLKSFRPSSFMVATIFKR